MPGPKLSGKEAAAAALVCGALLGGAVALGFALEAAAALPPAMAAHGALMITAWAVMMPAGAVVARYFKVAPRQEGPTDREDLFWWRWHRGLQYGGVVLATLGFGAILSETGGRLDTLHGRIGLAVMAVGWLQVISAAARGTKGGPTDERADPRDPATWRGDHYDMSPRRLLFEAWHKPAGWSVIALAGVVMLLGIDLVGAPAWLVVLAALLQGGIVLAIVDGALRHRRVDTYTALWGSDPAHPGNRREQRRAGSSASRKADVTGERRGGWVSARPASRPGRDGS